MVETRSFWLLEAIPPTVEVFTVSEGCACLHAPERAVLRWGSECRWGSLKYVQVLGAIIDCFNLSKWVKNQFRVTLMRKRLMEILINIWLWQAWNSMALNLETKPFPIRPSSLRLAAVHTYRWKSSHGRHSTLFPGASKCIEHDGGKTNSRVCPETSQAFHT